MDILLEFLVNLSKYIRSHIDFVALSIAVSLLMVFGKGLNGYLKNKLASVSTVLRWLIFIAVCIFVYGFMFQISISLLTKLLSQFDNYFLSPIVVITFIVLGLSIEKNK